MFKVNNKDTRMTRRSGVIIVNFEIISHFVLMFLLLTLSKQMPAGRCNSSVAVQYHWFLEKTARK